MVEERKTVGLCLAYNGTNYGQLLQAFSTQYIIEKYGFDTEIIDYHSGNRKGIKFSYSSVIVTINILKNKIKSKVKALCKNDIDEKHKMNMKDRQISANTFRNAKLHNIIKCEGIDQLKEYAKKYCAVLVGSDQIWLPDVSVTNFYTLRFAPQSVTRISYATSLGVAEYPNYAKKSAADFLNKIDYLSVREEQGKKIIESISDAKAQVVVDPTYLLTKDEWLECIPSKKITEKGYILCYFLSDNKTQKEYIKRFADSNRLRIVSILSNESTSNDYDMYDEIVTGKGPEEFVNLIRNAEYILTDSFHGMAFSILNEKQFLVFYRVREDTKLSRNSRIDNVINMLALNERLIINPEKAEVVFDDIDYKKVNKIIDVKRTESLRFLERALFNEER